MSIKINNHEFEGKVLDKVLNIKITEEFSKHYLYCRGTYMHKGSATELDAKFTAYSFGGQGSKFDDVVPGDEIKFEFIVKGKYDADKKDKQGAPFCFMDLVPTSRIEITDTAQRRLYDNTPTPKAADVLNSQEAEDEETDLPF